MPENKPDPIVYTYMAVLVELIDTEATFRTQDVTLVLTRDHWVNMGRPGTIDIRVQDMAGL